MAAWRYITFYLLLVFSCQDATAQWKVCGRKEHTLECSLISSQTAEVQCINVEDSVDCLSKLTTDNLVFGAFSAEEILLAAARKQNAVVVAEVPHKNRLDKAFEFQTVAVVRSDYRGSLADLRGKAYCHFGFDHSSHWTDPVLKALELKVLGNQQQQCNQNRSSIEDHVESLSKFFGRGCRPGAWSPNKWTDEQLKRRYSNLCALCDKRSDCSYSLDTRESPHLAAMRCLRNRQGDVAYVALSAVQEYLKSSWNTNETEYALLCTDGSLQSMKTASSQPCTWVKQPWPAVLAKDLDTSFKLNQKFHEWFDKKSRPNWIDRLGVILFGNSGEFRTLQSQPTIKQYMDNSRGEQSQLPSAPTCRDSIRWCTTNPNEYSKCSVLSTAAQTHGLTPAISCAKFSNFRECLLKINTSESDIVSIPTQSGYIARSALKLAPSVYVEGHPEGHYIGVMVIRDLSVTSRKELKNKMACFPHFNGLGWLSFMEMAIGAQMLSKKSCPLNGEVFKIFSGVCLPGALDVKMNPAAKYAPSSACAACSHGLGGTCEANPSNPYFGERGALQCLSSGAGDVAFVNYNELNKILNKRKTGDQINEESLRILCNDDTIVKISDFKNIDQEKCAITHVIGHEIVTRNSLSAGRKKDIQFALETLSDWFGLSGRFTNVFRLFGQYNKTDDVMLPSLGVGFINKYETEAPFIQNYNALHTRLREHCSTGGVERILPTVLLVALTIVAILLN